MERLYKCNSGSEIRTWHLATVKDSQWCMRCVDLEWISPHKPVLHV